MMTRGWTLVETIKIVVSVICFSASLVMTAQAQDDGAVCWKPTYARGVGTIPGECAPGEHRESGLCYKICPAGFIGVGTACHQVCPQGFGSTGALDATCQKPAKFPRTAFPATAGGPAQCAGESQGRGCEAIGAALYVKPPPGYECAGPICQQTCPAGMTETPGGGACRKTPAVARGGGSIPACGSDAQAQGGLCYKNCNSGFGGAGPVCWGQCPASHPVDCGGMCGTHSSQCAAAVANQAISVLDFASTTIETIVTFGAAAGIRTAVNAAEKAAQEAAEAAITTTAKATAKASKAALRKALEEYAEGAAGSISQAQITNLAAMAAGEKFDFASLDPTGIASIVAAFKKPVCELPPGSNQPVVAKPKLAGQVFKGEAGFPGVYLVVPDGTRHRIRDQRFDLSETLKLCGMIGPGDISPDGSFTILPDRPKGWAGLQDAAGAAGVRRGKDFNLDECQGIAQMMKTLGKWKFIPRR